MRRFSTGAARRFVLCLGASLAVAGSGLAGTPRLELLAQPGPWPAVSGLIGYGERLWFVNGASQTARNAADVYSYDPQTGTARYEANLFSRDAGQPAVANGLLYWPFADARSASGRGEFMVTDGVAWSWHMLPAHPDVQVHALLAHSGVLYAATSARRAGIQRSDDGGVSWRLIYRHRAPAPAESRFTTLASHGGTLYAGLTSSGEQGVRLYRVDHDGVEAVPSWPRGRAVTTLTAHRGWLFGVHHSATESELWRTDGKISVNLLAFPGERVRNLASDGTRLWAVTRRPGGGALWHTMDGFDWSLDHEFDGAQPVALTIYGGQVYVGTTGPGERGALWGPPAPAAAEPAVAKTALPLPWRPPRGTEDELLARLDAILASIDGTAGNGEAVRALVRAVARSGSTAAGAALARHLAAPAPDVTLELFDGRAPRIPPRRSSGGTCCGALPSTAAAVCHRG